MTRVEGVWIFEAYLAIWQEKKKKQLQDEKNRLVDLVYNYLQNCKNSAT